MSQKIADIQIFRSIAIILVLLQHFDLTYTIANEFPIAVMPPFSEGVRLFFVISGYVVAKSFFSSQQINPLKFVTKRIFRIYPPLVLFIIFNFLVNLILTNFRSMVGEGYVKEFLISWDKFLELSIRTVLGTYINGDQEFYHLFGVIWSLAVEFQFYAAVAVAGFVLVFIFKRNKNFIEYSFLIACISLYLSIAIYRISQLFDGNILSNNHFIAYLGGWSFDFLLLGFILSIAERRGWLNRGFSISREVSLFVTPILILLPLILSALSRSDSVSDLRIFVGLASPISALCFAGLVYLASNVGCFPGTRTYFYRCLYWIGETSYSIYLFHVPVKILITISSLYLSNNIFQFYHPYFHGIYQIILMAIILIPLIVILYYKVEKPLIEYSYQLSSVMDDCHERLFLRNAFNFSLLRPRLLNFIPINSRPKR